LAWLGTGVLICLSSLHLSLGDFHNPGPGFLSFFAGLVLAVFSLVTHLQARKHSASGKEKDSKPIWTNRQNGFKMVLTVIALLVYSLLMNYLGFLVSTFLFLVFILRIIKPQRWPVALVGALLVSLAFYGIFELGLQSHLPKGPFKVF